jgi:hypothetical protein
MALDDRVACAAPACYLTTFRRLIETIGPQDAEQNIYGQVAFGMDHPDYVLMRAPRPTLISATSKDFFDARGTWENFRESKRIFSRLGFPERVDLVEVEGPHGVEPRNLASIAQWMRRWLLKDDQSVPVATLVTRPGKELLCTESGQVLTMSGEKSVFDLNAEYATELSAKREAMWKQNSSDQMLGKIRELLKVRPNDQLKPPAWEDRGREHRDSYHIDKLVLKTDSGIPICGLTWHPPIPSDDACLYLHDDGKLGDTQPGGPIEQLVDQNYAVVSVDLRGQGETASGSRDEMLSDWKTFSLAYLLGQPLLGLRVEDTLAAADFVAYYQKDRAKPRKVHLIGVGQSGIIALHAAAMYPERFASVTLRNTPKDWTSLINNTTPAGQLDSTVHGALGVYDLPDLVRLVGENKVRFEN